MAMYPEVQKKAHMEIDEVIGPSRLPTSDDRNSLPYINALIKESLRWLTVFPLGMFYSFRYFNVYHYDGRASCWSYVYRRRWIWRVFYTTRNCRIRQRLVNEVLLSSQILVLSYVAGLFFMTLKFMPIQMPSILTGISKTGNWTETWTIQIVHLVLAVGERSPILYILIFFVIQIFFKTAFAQQNTSVTITYMLSYHVSWQRSILNHPWIPTENRYNWSQRWPADCFRKKHTFWKTVAHLICQISWTIRVHNHSPQPNRRSAHSRQLRTRYLISTASGWKCYQVIRYNAHVTLDLLDQIKSSFPIYIESPGRLTGVWLCRSLNDQYSCSKFKRFKF